MMKSYSGLMFDNFLRIEAALWIPGTVTDFECTPDAFKEFVGELPDDKGDILFRQLPVLFEFDECSPPDNVARALLYVPGFLIKAATPVFGGDGSYSWGYFRTKWLYAPDEHKIASVAIAWAETVRAAESAKPDEVAR